MMVLTDRLTVTMSFPSQNVAAFGVVFSAARSATGIASTNAPSVPKAAIWTVSISGWTISVVYATSGGYIRVRRSPTSRGIVSGRATPVSMNRHDATTVTAATNRRTKRLSRRRRSNRSHVGCSVAIQVYLRRTTALTPSATSTTAMIASRMAVTYW